jgi:hypothetical protein
VIVRGWRGSRSTFSAVMTPWASCCARSRTAIGRRGLQKPAKAVRWLGLIPWTDIIDKKNDAPTVERFEPPDPSW